MSLSDTPRGERIHIGVFGRRNAGKSSIINALTGREASLVSEVAGTTTDPVYKAMELHPIGPVVFIDTAGFDDSGTLGEKRVEKTMLAAKKADIAVVVFDDDDLASPDDGDFTVNDVNYDGDDKGFRTPLKKDAFSWREWLLLRRVPIISVVSRTDEREDGGAALSSRISLLTGSPPVMVSARTMEGISTLREKITSVAKDDGGRASLLGGLVSPGDIVLLVMPQDIQAPKGRLILPQVETIRAILDRSSMTLCCTTANLDAALASMREPPSLIITDSQVFSEVDQKKPDGVRLTSFSVLFAAYKGDAALFREGAEKIDELQGDARILIAEACTHHPLDGDIGRVKIPTLLKRRLGEKISVDVVSGEDFPKDLKKYDLIVHCGACMFNRRYVMERVAAAREASVPMTNYGIVLAKLCGILDKISLPGDDR